MVEFLKLSSTTVPSQLDRLTGQPVVTIINLRKSNNELPRSKLRGIRTAQVDDLSATSHSDPLDS